MKHRVSKFSENAILYYLCLEASCSPSDRRSIQSNFWKFKIAYAFQWMKQASGLNSLPFEYSDSIEVLESLKDVNIEDEEFYDYDLYVWANVKYGDIGHITSDSSTIIKYAIAELKDDDFPYFRASERAYRWLKKHVENEEKE